MALQGRDKQRVRQPGVSLDDFNYGKLPQKTKKRVKNAGRKRR